MSASTEQRAIRYLLRHFKSPKYRFECKGINDSRLYLIEKRTSKRVRAELKSTEAKYTTPSQIFQNFVFSRKNEVDLFRGKKSKVIRVFLGNKPPKIFLLSSGILTKGATFVREERFVLQGSKNYKAVTPLQ
jgi:hypothetical protein